MSKGYRVYREGFPHHVFTRSKNGGILFYSTSDCLFYTTLYCCLARRYKICTRAFSIMPNHIHSNEQSPDKKAFDQSNVFLSGFVVMDKYRSCPLGKL